MIAWFDFRAIGFADPLYLWLLILPGALTMAWIWRVVRRLMDTRRHMRAQPGRVPFRLVGDLVFWLCLFAAVSLCIVSLAHPHAVVSVERQASADIVILQDGSASMSVQDVAPDRWQRSVRFLRAFANALSWKGDRVALALFAHFAAPQVRLTKDPNALFFFLDHLGAHSPFRLEDAPTWDTNIEEGVDWGLKLVERDEQLFGKTKNPKAFVVISDGQAWSGNVATALAAARTRDIVVHVVGVGTLAGGFIPEVAEGPGLTGLSVGTIRSMLDRDSLRAIARAGNGEYFEIGREPDREVASRIIATVRRRADTSQEQPTREELYWRFLLSAGVVMCVGTLFLTARTELWWQAVGACATILGLSQFLR